MRDLDGFKISPKIKRHVSTIHNNVKEINKKDIISSIFVIRLKALYCLMKKDIHIHFILIS